MKWIAALLMILNVLLFLGISDRQVEYVAEQQQIRPDVNPESMQLIKEVYPARGEVLSGSGIQGFSEGIAAPLVDEEDDLASVVLPDAGLAKVELEDGAVKVTAASEEDAGQQENTAALVALPETVAPLEHVCYRIGPFKQNNEWNLARNWAVNNDVEFEPVRSESRELRAVRVYVGPFESIAAAQGDVEVLKNKELDYFVYLRDDNQARISLGYFTQEELSIKFVDYLKAQNIDAKSQPEYRTLGPFDWMDVKVDSENRNLITQRDWQNTEIETIERECEPS